MGLPSRAYDTGKIPAGDCRAVADLGKRYRRGSQALMMLLTGRWELKAE